MTLGFKQQFPWKEPTNFREKILAGQGYVWLVKEENGQGGWMKVKSSGIIPQMSGIRLLDKITPKLHTFREDPHNRWKAGRKIEMVYRGAGYKIISHFNKAIPKLGTCVSTQKIEIIWIDKKNPNGAEVSIDGRYLTLLEINILSINDGFNSTVDFFRWFNKNWKGKIIHWTDLRY